MISMRRYDSFRNKKREEPQSPSSSPSPSQVRPNRRLRLSREDRERSLKSIPELGCYNSNHVLVNRERVRRELPPLKRSTFLDDLAQAHARAMAKVLLVSHSVSCVEDLQVKLESSHVAENVQCGDSIKKMHEFVMKGQEIPFENILGDFDEFGMATAKGEDGKLYLCQLFRSCA